jgi:glycosyltransferase involved in cell wall biosynthesis
VNILHVASDLNFSGANKELAALVGDQRHGGQVRVCCLGPRGAWTGRLEAAGVPVITLNWTRWLDVAATWRLRDMLFEPWIDAIQVWGISALRHVGLLAPSRLPHVIFCPPLAREWQPLNGWFMGRVNRVVVRDASERDRAIALGARPSATVVVPPGVGHVASRSSTPKTAPRLIGIGPIEKRKNFRDALWALDILNHLFEDVELEIVGRGSHVGRLREFLAHLKAARLHFSGECDDISQLVAGADICWLPGSGGCRHAALEAMAAGKPVIAAASPSMRELIPDGAAGFLIPAGDKIAMARKTRIMLIDTELCKRLGEAGQRHVRERYSQDAFLGRWREVLRAA